MKHSPHTTSPSRQIFAALVLASMLSLGAGTTFVNAATPDSAGSSQGVSNLKQIRTDGIPRSVLIAIRRDIMQRTKTPPGQLRLVSLTQETWSDSCLGLGQPNESCAQILIENGWRVVMTDGSKTWNYRTDGTGRIVRLEETPATSKLPQPVANAVLQAASQRTGLKTSDLQITKSEQITTNGCLSLPNPGEACTEIALKAWEVTVAGGQNRLVYRSNSTGSLVRLNEKASNISNTTLPKSVADAVLSEASQLLNVSVSQLRIAQSEQQTWNNGCLDLQRSNERCMGTPTPGWRVTVESKQQRLVYHTDREGSRIRLNEEASRIDKTNLPQSVTDAVLRAASQRTGLKTSELRIVKYEQIQGSSSCLGVPSSSGEACTRDLVQLWQVTVESGQQRLVYHTNLNGSQIRLNEAASSLGSTKFPDAVGKAVLKEASQRTGLSTSDLRIAETTKKEWSNGCLGLGSSDEVCTAAIVPGWQVTVTGERRDLVYRTNESGSQVRLDTVATYGGNGAVQIPKSELPPPLPKNTVFRAIASGGFAGRTIETRLLDDGQVVQLQVMGNGTTTTPTPVTRISRQEMQRFEQLLERTNFSQFHQLSFPPSKGAADFITVTMTSASGTTMRYADMVENQLPAPLQTVIRAWARMSSSN
ncbi:MAG TPA: hypothetical protein V6D50_17335 [Chroococcales cyanobacterium]